MIDKKGTPRRGARGRWRAGRWGGDSAYSRVVDQASGIPWRRRGEWPGLGHAWPCAGLDTHTPACYTMLHKTMAPENATSWRHLTTRSRKESMSCQSLAYQMVRP